MCAGGCARRCWVGTWRTTETGTAAQPAPRSSASQQTWGTLHVSSRARTERSRAAGCCATAAPPAAPLPLRRPATAAQPASFTRFSAPRCLVGNARGARPPRPRPALPDAPAHRLKLHGAERSTGGARVSVALAVLKRAGALCQQALRSRALRQHATAHVACSKRTAARRGGRAVARWLAWEEVVAQGRGALGAAVEADMRSGGAGAARAGKGLVRTLWGAVETGGRRMKESNRIRTE